MNGDIKSTTEKLPVCNIISDERGASGKESRRKRLWNCLHGRICIGYSLWVSYL